MTEPRELPLLACDSVALNLWSGKQTQHRVPMRSQPPEGLSNEDIFGPEMYHPCYVKADGEEYPGPAIFGAYDIHGEWGCRAPWNVGDVLYVRECFRATYETPRNYPAYEPCHMIEYRSDGTQLKGIFLEAAPFDELMHLADDYDRWRPNIHMPKWAARTWLRVNRVWVERIQDISPEDCWKEGIRIDFNRGAFVENQEYPDGFEKWSESAKDDWFSTTARAIYISQLDDANRLFDEMAVLWDSLYGKPKPGKPDYSWNANPWVWCCEFERIER